MQLTPTTDSETGEGLSVFTLPVDRRIARALALMDVGYTSITTRADTSPPVTTLILNPDGADALAEALDIAVRSVGRNAQAMQ